MDITITFRTWPARAWIVAMRLAQYVIGTEGAGRWAVAGVERLVRFRIGRGPWQRVPRGALVP